MHKRILILSKELNPFYLTLSLHHSNTASANSKIIYNFIIVLTTYECFPYIISIKQLIKEVKEGVYLYVSL